MIKTCGKRKSKTVYSRKELETLAKQHLSLSEKEIRTMTKEALCKALGIVWTSTSTITIHPEKVCSDRKSKRYPHRYSKEELVRLILVRNPYVNKGRLKKASFETLCRLAHLPFVKTVRTGVFHGLHKENDKTRYYEDKEKTLTTDIGCLERSKRPPFQYQKRVVDHFKKHRGLIAVHSLGSGKTMTALLASQCYLDNHPQQKVLVISPTSLIANFKKEMMNFGDLRHKDRYEFFSFQGFFYRYKDQPRQCKDHFLIIDEAHNLRTGYKKTSSGKESGKISKVIMNCAEKANRVLLLTATPLINKKEDIVPLLNMVRDNPTEDNQVTKAMILNPQDLATIGQCKFSFYERERLNQDYPKTTQEDVYLVMKPQFLTMYNKVENLIMDEDIMRTFGSESKLKPFFNGIRRAVNILSELPEKDMLKSEKIRWILENLRTNPHKKTVIFSHFLDSGVEAIQNKIQKEFPTLHVAHITGSQPKKRRAEIVADYNNNKVDVLFISKAGGEGLDLKGTRQMILMESGWNENTEHQVIGRGVRFQSHSHLPPEEQNVKIYRLFHIKQGENVEHVLSPEYKLNYKDPSTWPSADLLLKKLSIKKYEKTHDFLQNVLKNLSIEKNSECQN
jgi:superfamily II DNA or RNA helicase